MSILGAAAITAGANIIGGGLSAWQSRQNVKDTNRANIQQAELAYQRNKELAQYTFDKNLEMWNLQNRYNAPGAQMQRLQEAGLNPHLMYGKGTVGNAQGMPQMQQTPYVAPRIDYTGRQAIIGSMAQAGLGAVSQALQIDQKREEIYSMERNNWIEDNLAEIKVLTGELNYDKALIQTKREHYQKLVDKNNAHIKQIEARLASTGLTLRDAVWLRAGAMVLSGISDELPILGTLKQTFQQFFNVFDLDIDDIQEYTPQALMEISVTPYKRTRWRIKRDK